MSFRLSQGKEAMNELRVMQWCSLDENKHVQACTCPDWWTCGLVNTFMNICLIDHE